MATKEKKLLIVESPAKAKTIKKFLGKDFTVKASVGHIRDLKKGRGKKAFGIDVDNNYTPDYGIIKGKEKTVKELKEAAEKADVIYLAPDPDREGEAIAWHLKEALGLTDEQANRVTYSAVTKKAVLDAVANPSRIDMDRVNAQQGRRVLDRLVGFNLSPFLWTKIAKNLSAGRVQSVAVKIVVEREREIAAFIPEEFWKISADLNKDLDFNAELIKWKDEKFALGNKFAQTSDSVLEIGKILRESDFVVKDIVSKESKGKAGAPFITSTLQQAASTNLGFGTSRTMQVAQRLYEGTEIEDGVHTGLITYMRTDSTRIAPEGIEEVRKYIGEVYSDKYLPETENSWSTKKNAQDAHEAIRPTSVYNTPEKIKPFVTEEQYKLYKLIWERFVACQMKPAIYNITTISINANQGLFEAKGRVTIFDGYTILLKDSKKDDDKYQDLPKVQIGDKIDLNKLTESQHFTKPPARFNEASLVRALEKEGIGRPSTYAPIVKTIKERGYVRLEKRAFHATELGMAVNDMLQQNFTNIMELQFTADMESDLDKVEHGQKDWVKLIDEFYKPFLEAIEVATEKAEPLKGRPYLGEEKCPKCGKGLVIKYSKNGAFLGCSDYPECKGLIAMPGEGVEDEESERYKDEKCPICSSQLLLKTTRYGKKFLACSQYPDCKGSVSLDNEGNIVTLPKIDMDCNKCGKKMEVKVGRMGPFLACSGYPDCKNTIALDKNGEPVILPEVEGEVCEKCGADMVVKNSRRGPFLACSAYPKCKNAKPLKKDDETEEKEVKE
ncbi:type I DNA topoisomerase [Thiospirochaeta perfilievii]|uniref:DNA topoisomerase 1 n=1 Tax=Thiospirochaeta perfilievii TaxID=252967 RepID=A0A5C1QD62_9SPIO|nr:type I DNA topoisomerase [Thiospirochaeta perfilievii]QEN05501.1 type I DNA topoisomerase [Thiospirochaeta perfilievii]